MVSHAPARPAVAAAADGDAPVVGDGYVDSGSDVGDVARLVDGSGEAAGGEGVEVAVEERCESGRRGVD